jgi:hypothetical protein
LQDDLLTGTCAAINSSHILSNYSVQQAPPFGNCTVALVALNHWLHMLKKIAANFAQT